MALLKDCERLFGTDNLCVSPLRTRAPTRTDRISHYPWRRVPQGADADLAIRENTGTPQIPSNSSSTDKDCLHALTNALCVGNCVAIARQTVLEWP